MSYQERLKLDDDSNNYHAIGAVSASMQLPKQGGWYLIQAFGETVYFKGGGSGVASSLTDHSFGVASGGYVITRLRSAYLAWIGVSGVGSIVIAQLEDPA